MFDRLTLSEDLVDCRGRPLARKGTVVSPESINEAAMRAPADAPRRGLADTRLAEELAAVVGDPTYAPLFERAGARAAVERVLADVALPEPLVCELLCLGRERPALLRHAAATSAVSVRMLLAAVGPSRSLPDLAAAALLHDLGMRHLPHTLLAHAGPLDPVDSFQIAAHPLLGAYHLATVLGAHAAVAAARSHHWRCGQGYPGLSASPSRAIEVIAVASTFTALTQPRAFRAAPYDARGAADVLVHEVTTQRADGNTVKLLLHALRGGGGDPRQVRFGVPREGHGPEPHHYVHVSAPPRSPL